ncbi:hypothetical protein PBI_DEWDROP_116 [Microbacterium phage Dewdrop]|nr:hypothetical protein PBI_LEAF_116 [Microbacterium phage Leaf]QGZ17484.1 hypothetical protein PBI_DEWDROP_116 [Microbacterium phage Dewdrop]
MMAKLSETVLQTATNYAKIATLRRERAEKYRRMARRRTWGQWFMFVLVAMNLGVVPFTLFFSENPLWLRLLLAGFNVAAAGWCGFLGWKAWPKMRITLLEQAAIQEKEAEEPAREAERALLRYELRKWQEDFEDLRTLTKPPVAQALERQLRQDKAALTSPEQTTANVARFLQNQHRQGTTSELEEKVDILLDRAAMRDLDDDEVRQLDGLIDRLEEEYAKEHRAVSILPSGGWPLSWKSRGGNELLDLSDWQGDRDPRRDWADTVCDYCGQMMGGRSHEMHYADQWGRLHPTND